MKHFGKVIGSALFSSVFLLPGSANAEIKERTIRFAFQNAQDHPQGQGAKKFAELIEQKSGGKIKVRLFPVASSAATFKLSRRSRAAPSI